MARPAASGTETAAPTGALRHAWDQFGTLAVAVGVALLVRACVIEPFRIPSGSMFPNLLIGDHLFVNKFLFGARVPLVGVRFPSLRGPERGDVVVFDVAKNATGIFPVDRRPELPTESFVKRVIGMPGDVVELRGGQLVLNGEPVKTTRTGETFTDPRGRSYDVLREELPGGVVHTVLDDPRMMFRDGRWVIEDGRFLMMGDNRDDSNDSRIWGTVRREELKGPAFLLYWSWDFEGSWLSMANPLTWIDLLLHRTRWDRMFDPVE